MTRDYEILCLACGCIAPEYQWTYWQRAEDDSWRRSRRGESDPMMRCPSCRWEHTDYDSNPGIFDGTQSECLAYMREVEEKWADTWDERHAEIGSSGRPEPTLAVGQVWSGTGTWCRIIDLSSPWPDMVTVETPKPRARKVPRPMERSFIPRKEFGTRLHLREAS